MSITITATFYYLLSCSSSRAGVTRNNFDIYFLKGIILCMFVAEAWKECDQLFFSVMYQTVKSTHVLQASS